MKQPQNINDVSKTQGSPSNFTGATFIQPIASEEDGPTIIARVTFEKGAHTFWHTHGGEQVLYFLEGKGRVYVDGEGIIEANPGDIVRIPPDTRHWHGSHPDEPSRMSHLAITNQGVT